MSKTEGAPVSSPEALGTLRSEQPGSALETSDAMNPARARQLKIAAGSGVVLALGAAIWVLGSSSPRVVTVTSLPSAAPTALPSERELTVKPDQAVHEVVTVRLATRPTDVEVWLGDRKIGTTESPVSLPRGSDRLELHLKKAGFADQTVSLAPDRDQVIDATLTPLAIHREPATSPPPARPVGSSAVARPADSAGKLDRILGGRE